MLGALRRFLNDKHPTRRAALAVLRGVFAAMFLAQSVVAGLLFTVLSLVDGGEQTAGTLVSQILLVLAAAQLPLGVMLAYFTGKSGGKGAALSATLLGAVILSTPAWFLAFALLIGSAELYLLLLLVVLVNAYGAGFLLCGKLAEWSLLPEPKAGLEPPS